jgi:hypothetical protein
MSRSISEALLEKLEASLRLGPLSPATAANRPWRRVIAERLRLLACRDPSKAGRVAAVIDAFKTAEKLPAPKHNPRVSSPARAAQGIESRKM